MAANINPIFVATINGGLAQISVANTARDGSGTLVTVVTGGTNGSRYDRIDIVATGNTTAGMVRLFLFDGTNTRLWEEIPVSAVTLSNPEDEVFKYPLIIEGGLVLPVGWELKAAPHNAETFNVIASQGGDY